MQRIGVTVLAAAMLAMSGGASAQSEMEQYQQNGDRLLTANRENIEQTVQLATRALRDKDYKTARKYAQAVTRADPKRAEAFLLLGAAQSGLEDYKAARGTYTTAVRLAPGNAEAHAGLGVAYARTNDPKAQTQLAWIATQAQQCGSCGQASQLAGFRRDIESAIAAAAASSAPGR